MPLKSMLRRSPSAASSSSGSVCLETGRLSPVSAASAVWSAADSSRRASAGIVSPSSIRSTSPGTSSRAGIDFDAPLRTTRAVAADISRSAATAFSARDSCT